MDAKAKQRSANAGVGLQAGAPRDRPADLWRVPASDAARSLVGQVVRQIEDHEHRRQLRKLARSEKHQAGFEATVRAVVCDLVHHHLSQSKGGIAVTRDRRKLARRSRYRPPALNDTLPHVLDAMAALGVLEMTLGSLGLQTTICAAGWLCERIASMGLGFADLGRDDNEELVILRGHKRPRRGGTMSADLVEYDDDDLTVRLRDELRAINAWLDQADFALTDHPGIDTGDRRLRRIFNNGRFDHGGRLAGGWWMNLGKDIRREHVRIRGERVVTLDFAALYIRLAYAHVGAVPPSGDLYTCIAGLATHRKAAKVLLNTLLFDDRPRRRKPKGTVETLPDVPVGELTAAIERAHAPIAQVFGQGIGFHLMNLESTILVEALIRLRDLGIVGLPVHDALIVARSDRDAAVKVMTTTAEELAGCSVPVVMELDEEVEA